MLNNRELRERVQLLEAENEIITHKLKEIEKQLKQPIKPHYTPYIHGGLFGTNITYDELRKKYRLFKVDFFDGL